MTTALAGMGVAALIALSACGGDSPDDVVRETAERLGEIRSGTLTLDVRAEGRGAGANADVGFSLRGPFALAAPGKLPVARLRYTQRNGSASESATFISTGERAWIETGGAARELTGSGAAAFRGSAADGLRQLRLHGWLRDPSLEDDGDLHRVRARLDVPAALSDLARALGRGLGLDEHARAQLERAVRSAPVTLWTGSDDRLLRRLDASVRLELSVPEAVREQLGDLVGGRLRLHMRIDRLNEPVSVGAP